LNLNKICYENVLLRKDTVNYLLSTDQFILDSISQLWNFLFRALKVILEIKRLILYDQMPDTVDLHVFTLYGWVDIFEPAHLIAKLKAGQKVGT